MISSNVTGDNMGMYWPLFYVVFYHSEMENTVRACNIYHALCLIPIAYPELNFWKFLNKKYNDW